MANIKNVIIVIMKSNLFIIYIILNICLNYKNYIIYVFKIYFILLFLIKYEQIY